MNINRMGNMRTELSAVASGPRRGDAILNVLPLPVLLIGPNDAILDANNAAEAFFADEPAGAAPQ